MDENEGCGGRRPIGGRGCCGRVGSGGRGALVEPAALASLVVKGSHGYDIKRTILEATGGELQVDAGGLYRVLRRLEADGHVSSSWSDDEETIPRRRDYVLTKSGMELARGWATHLRERERIAGVLAELLEQGLTEQEEEGADA